MTLEKKTSEVMVMIVSGSLDMRLMTQPLSSARMTVNVDVDVEDE